MTARGTTSTAEGAVNGYQLSASVKQRYVLGTPAHGSSGWSARRPSSSGHACGDLPEIPHLPPALGALAGSGCGAIPSRVTPRKPAIVEAQPRVLQLWCGVITISVVEHASCPRTCAGELISIDAAGLWALSNTVRCPNTFSNPSSGTTAITTTRACRCHTWWPRPARSWCRARSMPTGESARAIVCLYCHP